MTEPGRSSSPASLRVAGLEYRYRRDHAPAVDGVDLQAEAGQMLTLLGPSGCGKTTTLRMIAGLLAPTGGRILVDDQDITGTPVHRRNMGMVFQNYALFPHLSVGQNVSFGLEMRRIPKARRRELIGGALARVGLEGYAERATADLSGGQQQRVALARALVVEPSMLLLDEPLSNLDASLRASLRDEIRQLQRRSGTTAVFVTHDQQEALAISDRIAVMNAGRVEQLGTPDEIFNRPASRFVASFIGQANVLDGRVLSASAGTAALEVPGLGRMEGRITETTTPASGEVASLVIHPHRISLAPAEPGDEGAGQVTASVFTGTTVQTTVEIQGQPVRVEGLTGAQSHVPAVGDPVRIEARPADAWVIPS